MHWLSAESLSVNQATWIWSISRILFNNLTLENADENLIEGQVICLCLFIGMICNPYPIVTNCVNNILKVHLNFTSALNFVLFYHSRLYPTS